MARKPDHGGTTEQRGSAGLQPDPVIEAYKRDIDRSLLRENLKLTAEQRFLKPRELQRLAIVAEGRLSQRLMTHFETLIRLLVKRNIDFIIKLLSNVRSLLDRTCHC